MEHSLTGQLLLASPALQDPNFSRTVVLIGVHQRGGCDGRRAQPPIYGHGGRGGTPVEQAVDKLEPVYVEGPCNPPRSCSWRKSSTRPRRDCSCWAGSVLPEPDADIDELTETTERTRVFAGYAGWSEGQLDAEARQRGLDRAFRRARRRVHRHAARALECGAHTQGRRLRAACPDARGPEPQLVQTRVRAPAVHLQARARAPVRGDCNRLAESFSQGARGVRASRPSIVCIAALLGAWPSIAAAAPAPRPQLGGAGVPAHRRVRAGGHEAGLSVGIMSATQGAYSDEPAPARHHPGRAVACLGLLTPARPAVADRRRGGRRGRGLAGGAPTRRRRTPAPTARSARRADPGRRRLRGHLGRR